MTISIVYNIDGRFNELRRFYLFSSLGMIDYLFFQLNMLENTTFGDIEKHAYS